MRTLPLLFILISSFLLSFFTVLQNETFANCLFAFSQPNCGYTNPPYCQVGDPSCTLEG